MRALLLLSLLLALNTAHGAEDVAFDMTIYIKAPKAAVWKALVDPATASTYFMCPLLRMGGAAGEEVAYGRAGKVLIAGKIVTYVPEATLAHTFVFDPASHKGTAGDAPSTVHYTLSEEDGITTLALRHDGFAKEDQTYANIVGGWPWILSNLKTCLETGRPLR